MGSAVGVLAAGLLTVPAVRHRDRHAS
jgi:hypothetical protein